jgi:hypothetical protein
MRGLFILILTVCISNAFSQQADTIYYKKGFGTAVFRYQGKMLRPGQMEDLVRHTPGAKEEMHKAVLNYNIYVPVGIAGGAMMGWAVGQNLAGAKMNYPLFGSGLGLALISIPLYNAYARHSVNAARMFNKSISPVALRFPDRLTHSSALGLSLRITF